MMWRRFAGLLLGWLGIASLAGAAPAGSPWGENYFPNVPLTTQDGKQVHFYDDLIKGKVVAINFIFTGCSAICPAETAKMRQVQELLGGRVGKDIFFYSISIDPLSDSPEVLKAYSQKFDVQPGWLFLTGKPDDIDLLRKKLGLLRPEGDDQKNDHNTSLMVGNESTGQWMKRSSFDNAQVLAGVIGGWLHNWKVAQEGPRHDYAEAGRLANLPHGETLFRTRCASCHSVGEGDGLGPDLSGVASKRDRNWLMRWIKTPDKMLSEKDPAALALYIRYRQLAMPNLGLNDVDAAALIDYMQSRSKPPG